MFDFNGTLLLVLVSFIIYVLIMKPLFFDRLMTVLDERDAVMSTAENKANAVADKFKQLEKETQEKLQSAHHSAQATVKEATSNARVTASEIRCKAEENAKSHISQVVATLQESTQHCYETLSPQRNEWAKAILSRLQDNKTKRKEACQLS